jgi:hypothetical protein
MKKRKYLSFLSISMHLQSYRFRLRTAIETFKQQNSKSNSNNLLVYFKGERGLTQTLIIPLNKLREEIYECALELLDVGNVNRGNYLIFFLLFVINS